METITHTPADQFIFRMIGEVCDNPDNVDVIELGKKTCQENQLILHAMRHLMVYYMKEIDNVRSIYKDQIEMYKQTPQVN